MKILVSPNAFKGTIEADEAAQILGATIQDCLPYAAIQLAPIADGGDGTCYLLGTALGLEKRTITTLDAIGRTCTGFYFLDRSAQKAYLDVSTVSGIKHLKSYQGNPWIASSFGTGELVKDAIAQGAQEIVLGLGGSASVDLGLGILGGMGFQFLDEKGREIPFFSDTFFQKIKYIQAPIAKQNVRFLFLCDVNNYFHGPLGAIPIFGPQKGLATSHFEAYEDALNNILKLLAKKSKKNISDQAGFGAAGGIAYGLSFFYEIAIQEGASYFFECIMMDEMVKEADWIITGEGMYDAQSAAGKGSYELLKIAQKHQKQCVLITAGTGGQDSGIDHIIRLPDLDMSCSDFKNRAQNNLREAVSTFCKTHFH